MWSLAPNSTEKMMWELASPGSWPCPTTSPQSLCLIWFSRGGFVLNFFITQPCFPSLGELKWWHVLPLGGHFPHTICSLKICWTTLALGGFSSQLQTCIFGPFLPSSHPALSGAPPCTLSFSLPHSSSCKVWLISGPLCVPVWLHLLELPASFLQASSAPLLSLLSGCFPILILQQFQLLFPVSMSVLPLLHALL